MAWWAVSSLCLCGSCCVFAPLRFLVGSVASSVPYSFSVSSGVSGIVPNVTSVVLTLFACRGYLTMGIRFFYFSSRDFNFVASGSATLTLLMYTFGFSGPSSIRPSLCRMTSSCPLIVFMVFAVASLMLPG